jgi:hypothetical protein
MLALRRIQRSKFGLTRHGMRQLLEDDAFGLQPRRAQAAGLAIDDLRPRCQRPA